MARHVVVAGGALHVDAVHDRQQDAVLDDHRRVDVRGTTVSHHIRQLRLERARLELRQPGCQGRSITDIPWRCGSSDLTAFSRAFRAAYGTTPTRYRSGTAR